MFEALLETWDHEHRLGSFQRPAAVKKNVVTPDLFFKRHKQLFGVIALQCVSRRSIFSLLVKSGLELILSIYRLN